MSVLTSLKMSAKYAVLAIAVAIGAIIYYQQTLSTSKSSDSTEVPETKLFSVTELSMYDGIQQKELYLAVAGKVFDVTKGSQHYKKGSSYHYFVGKDGTRALVTGNFKDESSEKDHVIDLPCSDLLTIVQWRQTFKQKYTYVGLLAGRYYDESGAETPYMSEVKQRVKQCKIEKEEDKKHDQMFPPCNVVWTDDGIKVWCTKASGGIVREWVGVPRQIYRPGEDHPVCVCVKLDKINSSQLKEYDQCSKTSTECFIIDK